MLGVIVHEGHNQNGDARSQASARSGGANSWSPDMPHEEFAKLQARIRGGPGRTEAAQLHIERDGVQKTIRPGTHFTGSIQSVDGDRITQHIGRGHTVTWSREELCEHFNDPKAFDAAMQPGHMMGIGVGRNGVVDAQQRVPGMGGSRSTISRFSSGNNSTRPISGTATGAKRQSQKGSLKRRPARGKSRRPGDRPLP